MFHHSLLPSPTAIYHQRPQALASSAHDNFPAVFWARGASAGPGLTALTALWAFTFKAAIWLRGSQPLQTKNGAKAPDLHRGQGGQAGSLSSSSGQKTIAS